MKDAPGKAVVRGKPIHPIAIAIGAAAAIALTYVTRPIVPKAIVPPPSPPPLSIAVRVIPHVMHVASKKKPPHRTYPRVSPTPVTLASANPSPSLIATRKAPAPQGSPFPARQARAIPTAGPSPQPALPPRITSLRADRNHIARGGTVSLCVTAVDARKISIRYVGQWTAPIVCAPVRPLQTTTYDITAYGVGVKSDRRSITITVDVPASPTAATPEAMPTPEKRRRHHRRARVPILPSSVPTAHSGPAMSSNQGGVP